MNAEQLDLFVQSREALDDATTYEQSIVGEIDELDDEIERLEREIVDHLRPEVR